MRRRCQGDTNKQPKFQLTHPMRGATPVHQKASYHSENFNSHTPCGVRRSTVDLTALRQPFQLTHPMRGATVSRLEVLTLSAFQLTHPMRGATFFVFGLYGSVFISTHTPHAGCDVNTTQKNVDISISTHTPHAGCDMFTIYHLIFSSYFNSHTPCGVRHKNLYGYR